MSFQREATQQAYTIQMITGERNKPLSYGSLSIFSDFLLLELNIYLNTYSGYQYFLIVSVIKPVNNNVNILCLRSREWIIKIPKIGCLSFLNIPYA